MLPGTEVGCSWGGVEENVLALVAEDVPVMADEGPEEPEMYVAKLLHFTSIIIFKANDYYEQC